MAILSKALGIVLISTCLTGGPITWVFSDVSFMDGGTLSGSFTFDADGGTPCSTGGSPCGLYSNISVTTTPWANTFGGTFTEVCEQDVVTCLGVSPDSTEVLLLTSAALDQTGLPGLVLFFADVGVGPPLGLSDAGGILDITGVGGLIEESICGDPYCSGPSSIARDGIGGLITGTPVPEPSCAVLIGVILLGLSTLAHITKSPTIARRKHVFRPNRGG